MKRHSLLLWLPFTLIMLLLGVFYVGLKNPDDHIVASQMVGQQLPEFDAIAAIGDQPGAATRDFRDGKPRLLNVFASWCLPCVEEIPILMRLEGQGVEIAGIAIHDTVPDLEAFLAKNGNPYSRIGLDQDSRAQIAFGSAGVPETFVVDGRGKVIHQHIGVVTADDMPRLVAMLEAAK